MFWKLRQENGPETLDDPAGRYVLQRDTDAHGEHLDLRLECDGYLIGWRIDGSELGDDVLATEKSPHAMRWLDAAERNIAAGQYAIERNDGDARTLLIETNDGVKRLRFERDETATPAQFRALMASLTEAGVNIGEAATLLNDGMTARARAVERLCGLGRELDGAAFNVELWRKSLRGLSLDDIHEQLRAFEVRFDAKYPPRPISQPERLEGDSARAETALEIARG